MAALSKFFSNLYSMSTVFFTLLLLEVVILIRSFTGAKPSSDKCVITTTQYLKIIEDMNPTSFFTEKLRSELPECRVCLSEFEEGEKIRKLQCNHTFHRDCLDKWLQQCWATCPLCRTKVLPEEVVAGYHRMRNQVEYDGSDEEMIFFLSALHGNSLHRYF
ncbi:hypothetical protein FNV43_RR18470 [Rhamnella rubrinervis]|uniref:RING-type domain-containing protein n=1 Tax=Rhamnella rubrinervis TaxID=2594499 RepID=A0A8K0E5X3_9ROSA|nr:hypothetical protein FNV43_RR18470 [Rhamnella rubrinervis]